MGPEPEQINMQKQQRRVRAAMKDRLDTQSKSARQCFVRVQMMDSEQQRERHQRLPVLGLTVDSRHCNRRVATSRFILFATLALLRLGHETLVDLFRVLVLCWLTVKFCAAADRASSRDVHPIVAALNSRDFSSEAFHQN